MENDVDELVTLPFQQLLDTAKSALDNVGDSRDIEVLAQSLVKDIERGMGKIGPICKRNLDQYGQNFLDALRENDQLSDLREELDQAVWNFEGQIEDGQLAASDFSDLQKMVKDSAIKIAGILRRMKLEVPAASPQPLPPYEKNAPASTKADRQAPPMVDSLSPPPPISPQPATVDVVPAPTDVRPELTWHSGPVPDYQPDGPQAAAAAAARTTPAASPALTVSTVAATPSSLTPAPLALRPKEQEVSELSTAAATAAAATTTREREPSVPAAPLPAPTPLPDRNPWTEAVAVTSGPSRIATDDDDVAPEDDGFEVVRRPDAPPPAAEDSAPEAYVTATTATTGAGEYGGGGVMSANFAPVAPLNLHRSHDGAEARERFGRRRSSETVPIAMMYPSIEGLSEKNMSGGGGVGAGVGSFGYGGLGGGAGARGVSPAPSNAASTMATSYASQHGSRPSSITSTMLFPDGPSTSTGTIAIMPPPPSDISTLPSQLAAASAGPGGVSPSASPHMAFRNSLATTAGTTTASSSTTNSLYAGLADLRGSAGALAVLGLGLDTPVSPVTDPRTSKAYSDYMMNLGGGISPATAAAMADFPLPPLTVGNNASTGLGIRGGPGGGGAPPMSSGGSIMSTVANKRLPSPPLEHHQHQHQHQLGGLSPRPQQAPTYAVFPRQQQLHMHPEQPDSAGLQLADNNNNNSSTVSTFLPPAMGTLTANLAAARSHPYADDGLIAVPEDESPDGNDAGGPSNGGCRTSDHSLLPPSAPIGPASSFCQYRGFCSGALEVMRGSMGVKKIKKPGYATHVVAKCNGCLFELEWAQVDLDIRGEDSANFVSGGVGFRLRFLSKCHLATRHVDEQLYGCVFCNHLGRTVEESDATVFFSQKKLFAHLARHPRPLPKVPGLTVVEATEVPRELKNNYDLHFFNPQAKSVVAGIMREISRLPSAAALETVKPAQGLIKRPPDNATPLSFAVGQRIVGVEFPAQYEGLWCTGWTDGEWGAFPADSVKLEPPPLDQIEMKGTSFMQAKTRWKFQHKDKEKGGWLKFEKGELITNINWTYADHWCWYGCNKSGKWGCFPQSHIMPNTLADLPPRLNHHDSSSNLTGPSDAASTHSSGHASSKAGLFQKMSMRRHRSGEPDIPRVPTLSPRLQ